MSQTSKVLIIGAGVGGLTAGALLAKAGYDVTVLEGQTYPGGCASTWTHKHYRFDSGATVAGGFQPYGPHYVIGELLDIDWKVHRHDPAWVVHLPDRSVALTADNQDVLDKFPGTEKFWEHQSQLADIAWKLSSTGMPFPPTDINEAMRLIQVGLQYFPQDLRLAPFALSTVYGWAKRHGLAANREFMRFLDAQLLISAQSTTQNVNAVYGATALDLARQGVYHVEGGMGGIAQTLADKLTELGGQVKYRHRVTRIKVENDKVTGVFVKQGRRSKEEHFIPADFVLGNFTPWDADKLLGDDSPNSLRKEVIGRKMGFGAFVLHLGVDAQVFPSDLPDHHQIIADYEGEMGEGRSIYVSISPTWDDTRAPQGKRAVTVSTHTRPQEWWDLLNSDEDAYYARKVAYAQRMIDSIDGVIPHFADNVELTLPGTPVTYHFYTDRFKGMVGGFPMTSLFKARGPRTGISNFRLVGDSIFPGQSTAGVSLGALRVSRDVQRNLPLISSRVYSVAEQESVVTQS